MSNSFKRVNLQLFAIVIITILAAKTGIVFGQCPEPLYDWVAGSGDWSVPGNWSHQGWDPDTAACVPLPGVPSFGDKVVIRNGGSVTAINAPGAGTIDIQSSMLTIHDATLNASGYICVDVQGQVILNNGSLYAQYEQFGINGYGVIIQNGGTNSSQDYIIVGNLPGSNGRYDLYDGQVSTPRETIGHFAAGTFVQTGGINSVTQGFDVGLFPGSDGLYELQGGELHTTNVDHIGGYGKGIFRQSAGKYIGGEHVILGRWEGADGTYCLSGGTLSTDRLSVGYSGSGSFSHISGTNVVALRLAVAHDPGSSGRYELGGNGQLNCLEELSVGSLGTGEFIQTGTSTASMHFLHLGQFFGGDGTYQLGNNSQLSAGWEIVGFAGIGTFTQSGGTNTVAEDLTIGMEANSLGKYELLGGTLNVQNIDIGWDGVGSFVINGGVINGTTEDAELHVGGSRGSLTGSGIFNINVVYLSDNIYGTYGDQSVALIFEPYCLSSGGLFSARWTNPADFAGGTVPNLLPSSVFNINFDGSHCGQFTIAIPYNENEISHYNADESKLMVFQETGPSTYKQISDIEIDTDDNIIYANCDSFGKYAIAVMRNPITVGATNNWDGTVTVKWTEKGNVRLFRQEENNPLNEVNWPLAGSLYKDTYQPSEFKKKYIYIVKDIKGVELGRTDQDVMPDIVVVLVRGYDPFGNGIDSNYWMATKSGLVNYVKTWFENKGITCWDATASLNGTLSVDKNSGYLKSYLDRLRVGDYEQCKVNLFGHSMGGLISRKFSNDNPGIVKKIFCAQTPHTGSPLATIRGFWPNNEATDCLKPGKLANFNSSIHIGETKLYSTYSANPLNLFYDPFLIAGSAAILGLSGIHYQMYFPNTSDGAVPTVSAKGQLWMTNQIHIDQLYNSNLDHNSCHKHTNTLNKIMEWLGYPQPAGSTLKMQANQMGTTNEEPQAPLYFIAGFTGDCNNTSPVSKTVKISGGQKAYFQANCSDPNCIFTLTSPDSEIIDPCFTETNPNIIYNNLNGIMSYEIVSPQGGTWTMNLVTDHNLVQYGLTAFEDQQIMLSPSSNCEWINTGQTITLTAALSDNAGAMYGAVVSGTVTLPDATTQNITFYDNGTHGDFIANDGTYSYLFGSTSLQGRYNVDIHATGTISGGDFERTAMISFTASIANIVVNGAIIDQAIDINGNGKFDLLRITVPINVLDAKEYRLTASLIDSQGELISLLNSGPVTLDLDANSISADIQAKEIVKHNVSGPYTLENIQISDVNSGLVIASVTDYNTTVYQIQQFEPLDSDGDGVSDALELIIGTDPNKIDTDGDGATDYQEIAVDGDPNSYNPQTDSNPLVKDTDGDGMPDGYEISYGLNPLVDDRQSDLDGDGLTNIQEYNLHTCPDQIDTDDDGRNDKWEIDHSTNPLVYEIYTRLAADIDLDATVGISDLSIMANQWLSTPGIPSADIAPTGGDRWVNMKDFNTLASNWLKGI